MPIVQKWMLRLPMKFWMPRLERYPALGNTVESILKAIGEEVIVDFARRFIMENG